MALLPMEQDSDADSHLTMMEWQPWTQQTNHRLPKRFQDELPHPPPILEAQHTNAGPSSASETHQGARPRSPLGWVFTSAKNVFGLFCQYQSANHPTYEPDDQLTLEDLFNITSSHNTPQETPPNFYPYPNWISFLLGDWFWNGGTTKSQASFDSLIDIIGGADFKQEDVCNVNWDHINKKLCTEDASEWLGDDAGWTSMPVSISVPFQPCCSILSPVDSCTWNYATREFHHCKLVSIIKEKITGLKTMDQFHYEPYELHWHPPPMSESIRVQGELYSLPLFLDAHQDLQDSPGEPSCTLPWVEVTLMFSSDLTHLTAFGDVKLWPLYLFFGNNSKYLHCKPMSHLCKHVAYFIKVGTSTSIITAHILIINLQLPDSFKDFASSQTAGGHTPTTAFTTHCTRELMHEQWKILLDDTSLEAWEHGIVIMCLDGLLWWFYPWIFTYSADYPEKWVTKANIITTYNYSFF